MKTKLINVVGDEVHTLMITRVESRNLNLKEGQLLLESNSASFAYEDEKSLSIMTIIGGPYVGTQWAHLNDACLDELKVIYEFLSSEEGWNSVQSGDRINLKGVVIK